MYIYIGIRAVYIKSKSILDSRDFFFFTNTQASLYIIHLRNFIYLNYIFLPTSSYKGRRILQIS